MAYELTIGMAVYDDYARACMTIQALRYYHDMTNVELLIVANKEDKKLEEFIKELPHAKYVEYTSHNSTAQPRNHIVQIAEGKAVLIIDCHVLLAPHSISRLKQFYRENPDTKDLYQGPMAYNNLKDKSDMWSPVWSSAMLGIFTQSEFVKHKTEPYEIVAHGLGLFSCLKNAWLGFNTLFRGFGGEEGYIHEKYRQNGRKCICLPWLEWWHHSVREQVTYDNTYEDRIRNAIIGANELGLSSSEMIAHMKSSTPLDDKLVDKLVYEALEECKQQR